MTAPQPATLAQRWPTPVLPIPSGLSITAVTLQTDQGPKPKLLVEIVTAAGAAFAFLDPTEARRVFDDGVRLAETAETGIVRPLNSRLILPGQPE